MKILYAAAAFLLWLPAATAAVPTSSDIGKIENYLNSGQNAHRAFCAERQQRQRRRRKTVD